MAKLLEDYHLGDYIFEVYDDKPNINAIASKQTHSDIVLMSSSCNEQAQGDGIISLNDETLAIKTADCMPIAIIGINGIAMLHAGWRGVANKIVLNEKIEQIRPQIFYIGPHIRDCHFEVSSDFDTNFSDSDNFIARDGKYFFDMESEITSQIKQKYPQATVEASTTCTFENTAYNSYRRDKTTKRNWNLLKRI
jgi:copper oxidase (laccase) domain-containing protein